jgi:hypothetical protein
VPRPPLRARSATEIVDAAFQLYRRDPLTYLLLSAICYAPLLVLQLIVLGPATAIEEQIAAMTSGFSIVLMFGYWVSLSLLSATIVRLSSEDYLGRHYEPAVAVRDAVVRLPAVMFALLFKYLFILVGFFLFLLPALWVLARYFAVTSSIVLEGRGPAAAFGRSARLSRGRKMHILGTSLLAFLIFFVVYFAVTILGAMTGSVVITTLLTIVASIVAWPMFAITEMLLYYDARIRGEGFDIEMMEAGLGEPGGVTPSEPAASVIPSDRTPL